LDVLRLRSRWRTGGGDLLTRRDGKKLNDIDPEAWLSDVLRRINDHFASRLAKLLPWNWKKQVVRTAAAA